MLLKESKKAISLIYKKKINDIFPKYKNKDKLYESYDRVIVSIIHNDKDLTSEVTSSSDSAEKTPKGKYVDRYSY